MYNYIRNLIFVLFAIILYTTAGCGNDTKVYISNETPTEDVGDEEAYDTESAYPLHDGTAADDDTGEIFVYVCGAVNAPGVYELDAGDRIYEAIELAGGFSDDACKEAINLADEASDAQMIWVPTVDEASESGMAQSGGALDTASDGLIDINQATASELMTLPGIGQTKADSIISYRDSHGAFSSVEDIMNVDGIKEGVYNRIKDSIKVN